MREELVGRVVDSILYTMVRRGLLASRTRVKLCVCSSWFKEVQLVCQITL